MRQTPIQRMALAMADELERNRLEVILTPAEREVNVGAAVRTVISENPEWYQKLCAAHLTARVRRHRKPDTRVKRIMTIRALRAIGEGRKQRAKNFGSPIYRKWLMPIIKAELRVEKVQALESAPF